MKGFVRQPPSHAPARLRVGAARPRSEDVWPPQHEGAPRTNRKRTGYDSSNIQVLEGVEPSASGPGMYIGTTSSRGLHHLVYEVVDNAIDEAMAGRADQIVVTHPRRRLRERQDNGARHPGQADPRAPRTAVRRSRSCSPSLHAGGKFGGGGYRISGGLHGVGVSVVNALSEKLEVRGPCATGSRGTMAFARGKATKKLTKGKATTKTGTIIRFWPDPEIFTETRGVQAEDPRRAAARARVPQQGRRDPACIDERDELQGGLQGQRRPRRLREVPRAGQGDGHARSSPIETRARTARSRSRCSGRTGYAESVYSFANTINTHEGGMHEEGLKKSLTNVLNRYARAKGLLKEKDDNLIGEDVREGLIAIISVKLREPQFEGQTKTKLGNASMRSLVETTVNAQFAEWLEEHPGDGKRIAQKSHAGREGADGREAGPRPHAAQVVPRGRLAARQARRLPADRPGSLRAVHRGGRLGRRLGEERPEPGHPGDPADPRQDPERREGAAAQDPREPRDPGAHHRDRHGHRRGVRPREGAVPPDRAHGRRRRRRRAHPHAAADVLLPEHARADRRRLHVPRAAAPVPAQGGQAGAVLLHRARVGRLAHRERQRHEARAAAVQGPRRDGRRAAVGHHDGPGAPHAAAGHARGRRDRRPAVHRADGRGRALARDVHRDERASTSRTSTSSEERR